MTNINAVDRRITMAHGAGGRDSAELMREIFGKHFANPILDRLEDASPLDLPPGRTYVSTDSFVVTPIEFPGGDIGKLAVCGSVNDVLMMGAVPKYLTCGYIIEEGLQVEILDRIAESMASETVKVGVIIAAGDTKVIERRSGTEQEPSAPGLIINTSCIGVMPADMQPIGAAKAKQGDSIILSGTLGDHHACIMSSRMGIENDIKSDCALLAPLTEALLAGSGEVHTLRDVTRGGLATVLNEIALSSSVNIDIEDGVVPVSPAVKAFCGIMGLDPLYMGNEGKLVALVAAEYADEALLRMQETELGRNAAIIGRVAEPSQNPIVRMRTSIGGTRRIDMLSGEGLPRIC